MKRLSLGRLYCLAGALVFLIGSTGCITKPRVDWDSRVGTMTFDQAVIEMGPPDRAASLESGMTVAEWLTERGGVISRHEPFPFYGCPPYYGYRRYYNRPYGYSHYYSDVVFPDQYVRLVFGSDGVLQQAIPIAK